MNQYIIINLETEEIFQSVFKKPKIFDTFEEAREYVGIYELEHVWICELKEHFPSVTTLLH